MLTPKPGRAAELTLGDRIVPYRVTVSPSAKRTRIRVGPRGVEVVVPRSRPAEFAAEHLEANAAWVLEQLDAADRIGGLRRKSAAPSVSTVLYRGTVTPVVVDRRDTGPTFPRVSLASGTLRVDVPAGYAGDAAVAVERWLRKGARAVIEERVGVWQDRIGRRPARVFIRGQRTKWGNCSGLGNVSFNWRLVMAPPAVLDAIVVHELAHLVEPSHGPKFRLLVWSHCPHYDRLTRWLRDNESRLFTLVPIPAEAR